MRTTTLLLISAALLIVPAMPSAAAVNSACTPGTFAFINPMPRACASWSLDVVCVSVRLESTLGECIPLP
jgi:hypothetical protein